MDLPCQKIVWGVLPAVRAANAADLAGCGVSRTEAVRMMEITPSAVSRYISGKRGYRAGFDEEAKESTRSPAQDLKGGRVKSLVGRICKQVRQEDAECLEP